MARLRELGTVIWLRGDLAVALERARRSGARPMLAGRASAEIEALYRQREAYYRDAHVTIDTTGLTIDQVVSRILSILRDGSGQARRSGAVPPGGAVVGPPMPERR
jgi:shikimate kinase